MPVFFDGELRSDRRLVGCRQQRNNSDAFSELNKYVPSRSGSVQQD
jgi:hypothetical protein